MRSEKQTRKDEFLLIRSNLIKLDSIRQSDRIKTIKPKYTFNCLHPNTLPHTHTKPHTHTQGWQKSPALILVRLVRPVFFGLWPEFKGQNLCLGLYVLSPFNFRSGLVLCMAQLGSTQTDLKEKKIKHTHPHNEPHTQFQQPYTYQHSTATYKKHLIVNTQL